MSIVNIIKSCIFLTGIAVLCALSSCASPQTRQSQFESRHEYLQSVDDKLSAFERRIVYLKEIAVTPGLAPKNQESDSSQKLVLLESKLAFAKQQLRDLNLSNESEWQEFEKQMNLSLIGIRQTLNSVPAE